MFSRNRKRNQTRSTRLQVESLENRILLSASPWQNSLNSMDINGDTYVTPIDALLPINALNLGVVGTLQESTAPPILHDMMDDAAAYYLDSNGDGYLSPSDVISVINLLSDFTPVVDTEEFPAGEQSDRYPDVPGTDAAMLEMDWGYAFVDSELNNAYDADAFQFIASDDRVAIDLYNIDVPDGLTVELLNIDLETIATSNVGGMDNWGESNIDVPVELASTYYIVITGTTPTDVGEYVLDVYQYEDDWWEPTTDSNQGDDIHGDTPETATALEIEYGYHNLTSHIDWIDDVDTFQITVEQGQLDFSAYPLDNESLLKISVTDDTGELIALIQGNHEGTYAGITVTAGTYHLSIDSLNDVPGEYMLDVAHWGNYEWQPTADSVMGDDIHVDAIGPDATLLESDDDFLQRISHVDTADDVDVFRVTAIDDFISTTAYASNWAIDAFPNVRLFDSAGNEQHQIVICYFEDDQLDYDQLDYDQLDYEEFESDFEISIRDITFTADDFLPDDSMPLSYWPGGMYPVTAGEQYYLVVDGGIEGFVGQYTLEVTQFELEPWFYTKPLDVE
jgi:hypothetical protein